MGAAGRDFHNFNTLYRDNEQYEVVAFTATQIPGIENRLYPHELAGRLYPNGIPIRSEDDLGRLIEENKVDDVVFSYSDVSYEYVMHKSSVANRQGASFLLPAADDTMIESSRQVISVCAVRTGAGKSPTSRKITDMLRQRGRKVVVVRHPMPYGDLKKQMVQRYEVLEDLDKHECTIEEREEYGPLIRRGIVVYAGVDYEKILRSAEEEADIVIWDGGNNDFPFYRSNLHIVMADALRPGSELTHYPSEVNVRLADVVIINKVDVAKPEDVEIVESNIRSINPEVTIMKAMLKVIPEDEEGIRGKRVLAIEDGPTLTHGNMKFGAAIVAAKNYGASEIVDPRPFAVGSIKTTLEKYDLDNLLPAMGYGEAQIRELEKTINASDCDVVLSATPAHLSRILKVNKQIIRVAYELEEMGKPTLEDILSAF